jgi:hypothetical protein
MRRLCEDAEELAGKRKKYQVGLGPREDTCCDSREFSILTYIHERRVSSIHCATKKNENKLHNKANEDTYSIIDIYNSLCVVQSESEVYRILLLYLPLPRTRTQCSSQSSSSHRILSAPASSHPGRPRTRIRLRLPTANADADSAHARRSAFIAHRLPVVRPQPCILQRQAIHIDCQKKILESVKIPDKEMWRHKRNTSCASVCKAAPRRERQTPVRRGSHMRAVADHTQWWMIPLRTKNERQRRHKGEKKR